MAPPRQGWAEINWGRKKRKGLLFQFHGGSPGVQNGRANQLCTCSGPATTAGGGLGCSGSRALERWALGQEQPRHVP